MLSVWPLVCTVPAGVHLDPYRDSAPHPPRAGTSSSLEHGNDRALWPGMETSLLSSSYAASS